jgi:RNA polymerase sigma factor (sigma-70 family)
MNAPAEDPQASAHRLADHLFRHESGRMVAILTGIYGAANLQLAEDVVQEALVRALASWPFGVPDNPSAWLLRTAKNLAIDHLRREKNFLGKQPEIIAEMEGRSAGGPPPGSENGVDDDQLRMMFACCHPALPPESQSALALKTLCGFGTAEIANAFLISEAAVSKRLVRARQKLRSGNIPFQIPSDPDLPARLDAVLETIYLLFNEGHKTTSGDDVFRADLCMEAIRLGTILARHPAGNEGRTHALLALMCLTAARLPARTNAQGNLLLLENQDRSRWDGGLIQAGFHHLARSSESPVLTPFHFQAGIAACHASAASDGTTDWPRILSLYDRLSDLQPSPVVTLNRAVALSKVHGPDAAIAAIDSDATASRLENNHLLHSVLGELESRRGRHSAAARHFRRALELAATKPERILLAERLEACLAHEST